jgi:hypothetical protein
VSTPLAPDRPKSPFLFKPTRRELLIDIGIRAILMIAVAVLMFNLRGPINGHVFWSILIVVELFIFIPLLLTIILRSSSKLISPTAEQLARLKTFERSANFQAVWVTILACSLTYFVMLNGWSALLPYTMSLPLILLLKAPPKPNK